MNKDLQDVFLSLVRLGIGTSKGAIIPQDIDWDKLKALADEQGLSAVILDALNSVGTNQSDSMPIEMKLEWIGEVLQYYEQRYAQYKEAIGSLAGFYNQHGFKMMVLKGYACSLDWPKPKHRPCGDVDIWQFGKQIEADDLIAKEKGIKIDNSHHHHSVFYWRDFMVENHYDFIEQHSRRSSKGLETILKELGNDNSHFVDVNEERVYLPCPNLHALFLIRHMIAHFASVSITFRQILDWAFFVEKHTKGIDWDWLTGVLKEYHMYDFYNIINAICVGDLGFDVNVFPSVQFDPNLKERVLNDIFNPEYVAEEPRNFLKRLVYKYMRWQGNAWKQNLCFPESRASSFLTGLWAHIIKPAHL